jgi:hypothetical protein
VTYDYVRRLQRCVRCGHERRFGIAWPEGFVCIGCIDRATKLRGRCPGCGDERLLVGRDPAGAPICCDCAGIATCFVCRHCGKEDQTWYSRTCLACSLSIRLRRVLGDGGGVPAALEDEALELADRVAGLLVLLFAQSFTRVAALRLGAVTCSNGEVAVNLGVHPVPLPAAVASIFSRYLERRVNTGTTNTATDFLFPGCRPGQHVTAFQLTKRMNALGITKAERQGALTHLVNEAPAAVVAKATGYSLGSTAARSVLFGPDWADYAALKSSATR